MTDNLDDFFSDNAQWVDSSDSTSFNSAMPPQPPKSRRDMRRRRKQKRRRLYLTIIASLVVVVLIGVGVFFGVRALKHWKAANEANSQSQIEDYTGSGDKEVTFTVESGQGPAEIAENLVKAYDPGYNVAEAPLTAEVNAAADLTIFALTWFSAISAGPWPDSTV